MNFLIKKIIISFLKIIPMKLKKFLLSQLSPNIQSNHNPLNFKRGDKYKIKDLPGLVAHKKLLNLVFPNNKENYSLVDLGCLNGKFTLEFAKMGFRSIGFEIRKQNYNECLENQKKSGLNNLKFINDSIVNINNYDDFDICHCSGLLYHLDKPVDFIQKISSKTNKLLILQTHFSVDNKNYSGTHGLSDIQLNEGVPGRWYREPPPKDESELWASWENNKSFWIQREHLISLIKNNGFDMVFEQFDGFHHPNLLQNDLAQDLINYYNSWLRSSFIGIKL